MLSNRQLETGTVILCEEGSPRLDIWLTKQMPFLSRSSIQKLIHSELVLINSKPCRPKDPLYSGDKVFISPIIQKKQQSISPISMDLKIVYEDNDLLVVDKPKGLKVHPGAGEDEPTLVHGLLAYTKGQLSQPDNPKAADRPGIVHRIDKDTSGLLVCAKTNQAHEHLAQQFAKKTNLREYLALLDGCLLKSPLLHESYLARDPANRLKFASIAPDSKDHGKYAKSLFENKEIYASKITLAKVTLFTGRTHQIRVHSLELHMPIIGDPLYHSSKTWPQIFDAKTRKALSSIDRQMLHAARLGFTHPRMGRFMEFYADLPEDFAGVLKLLEPYRQHH